MLHAKVTHFLILNTTFSQTYLWSRLGGLNVTNLCLFMFKTVTIKPELRFHVPARLNLITFT